MVWDVFREMENLKREIDDAFRTFGTSRLLEPGFLPGLGMVDLPRINLCEDENNLYVEALIPGINPKELDLSVMKGTLTLAGERKAEEGKNKTWHRRERGTGKFLRTIELPIDVDYEKVAAEYHNGVLSVTLPKSEGARLKKITVKSA